MGKYKGFLLAQIPVLFCLFYGLYFMPRGTYWWDSGDFISAIASYGIAHPSGYPLYIQIARLFWLLTGSIWGINLVSLLSSILALELSAMLLSYLFYKRYFTWVFAAIPIIFFVPAFLENSLVALAYPITLLGIVILTFISLKLLEEPNPKLFILLGFLSGLFSGSHLFAVIFCFVLIVIYFLRFKGNDNLLLWGLIMVFLGASIYIYTSIRSIHNPANDWMGTPTLNKLVWLISMKGYAFQTYINNKQTLIYFLTHFHSRVLVPELGWIFLIVGILGYLIAWRRREWRGFLFILSILAGWNIWSMIYHAEPVSLFDWHRYWFLLFWAIWICAVFLFYELLKQRRSMEWLLVIILSVSGLYLSYSRINFVKGVNKNGSERYIKAVYGCIPYNQMCILNGDNAGFLGLASYTALGLRPDVSIVWHSIIPKVIKPEHKNLFEKIKEGNSPDKPIVSIIPLFNRVFPFVEPNGLIFQYYGENILNINSKTFWKEVSHLIQNDFKHDPKLGDAMLDNLQNVINYYNVKGTSESKECISLIDLIRALSIEHQLVWGVRIGYAMKNREFDKALEIAKMHERNFPWEGNAYILESQIYYAMGNIDEAGNTLDRGLLMADAGGRQILHSVVGKIALDAKDYRGAVEHYNLVIKDLLELNYDVTFNLALSYIGLREWDNALYYIAMIDKLNPADGKNYTLRGMVVMERDKDYKKAISLFNETLRKNPKDILALYKLAECYKKTGRKEEQLQIEERIRELKVNKPDQKK